MDHGCKNIVVPQKFLNRADPLTRLKEVDSKAMALSDRQHTEPCFYFYMLP